MPDACSTSVSPAVVVLEPIGQAVVPDEAPTWRVALVVGQRGLQFEPRVSTIRLGGTLRFTNGDTETHNVHVLSDGKAFNQSVPPGREVAFTPTRPGVVRVVCDIHSHMRAFVVATSSPWSSTCDREGHFRLRDVPDGRYYLKVWHELGEGLKEERVAQIKDGRSVELGTIAVESRMPTARLASAKPARRWADVIDRVGVLLSSSLKAAARPDGLPRARKLAQDAYFEEFENSGMETAVRQALGVERMREVEERFKDFFGPEIQVIAADPTTARSKGVALSRSLLMALSKAGADLDQLGVIDAAHLGTSSHAPTTEGAGHADRKAQVEALQGAFAGVRILADAGDADGAATAMGGAYFDAFHPIERDLQVLRPGDVVPLEGRFNALRGLVGRGLKGAELAKELEGLHAGVAESARLADAGAAAGGFGPAFLSSLGIILREGVEVILLLGMLFALVAKLGQPGALRAIRRGVALAVVASLATAVGLNLLLASAQGRTRELLEGLVMLAASGVLFYVSYWLISQSESRRWMEFLRRHARQGAEAGGFATLGLTAFLAVYREGAETALMYQAQVVIFGPTRAGLTGLAAGLAAGVATLALLYRALRSASARLPLRAFFKASGVLLFAMAVVFAGKAVGELQVSGHLKNTPLSMARAGPAGTRPVPQRPGRLDPGPPARGRPHGRRRLRDGRRPSPDDGPQQADRGRRRLTPRCAPRKPRPMSTEQAPPQIDARPPADPRRWLGPLIATAILGGVAAILLANLDLGGKPSTTARPADAAPKAVPAELAEHPIGLEYRDDARHLRVAAVWLPAVQWDGGQAVVGGDVIHMEADVKATADNPNGFAKNEFIPYLKIAYKIEPLDGGSTLSGDLMPMIASDGLHYGASVALPKPGKYRLSYAVQPPSAGGLGRHSDPASGVAPWWTPFEASYEWDYQPPTPPR